MKSMAKLKKQWGILLLAFCLLWQQELAAQEIPALAIGQLQDSIVSAKGVTIFNFWSTWCKPCIDEIPHFIEVARQFELQNVKLQLVSLDTRKLYHSGELKKWLLKKKWKANVWWLNETNADLYCPAVDSSWSGVIPATLIVNNQSGYRRFIEESLTEKELTALIVEVLTWQ